MFYNDEKNTNIDEQIIFDYFKYIKNKVDDESIFRLLSPILNIFFGVPNSKVIKSKINEHMKNHNLNLIEDIFMQFVRKNKLLLN